MWVNIMLQFCIKEADVNCQREAAMVLCFSVMCVLHSEGSSDTKIGRPPKKLIICQTQKSGKFAKLKKQLNNLETQKKRIWPNLKT